MGERSQRLVIAYHRPGSPGWGSRVKRLAHLVSVAVGRPVEPLVFEEAAQQSTSIVAVLLLTRGGHWEDIARTASLASIVPEHTAVAAIARRAEGEGREHLVLAAHRAKRLVESQVEDLDRLTGLLESIGYTAEWVLLDMNGEARLEPPGRPCMVFPLVFFDGRFAAIARRLASSLSCSYAGVFMEYGFWDLYQWLVSFFKYSTTAT